MFSRDVGRKIRVALILSLLSPFIGELVSGSSPPREYFNPFTFVFLWGFYGAGVLIMRELWVRWGGGYSQLMMLGIAYGIIEEGLAVKSFFDPGWHDLGRLAVYGRYLGVNIVWAFWLSIFHAVYSISIPVLLIQIAYPEYSGVRLLARRGLAVLAAVFTSTSTIIFLFLNPYKPPAIQYFITVMIVLYLVKMARSHSAGVSAVLRRKMNGRKTFLVGVAFALAFFILYMVVPETPTPWFIPCILGLILILKLYKLMAGYNERQMMALIIGLLTPLLLFIDIVLEISGETGMAAVGILTFAVLYRNYRGLTFTPVPSSKFKR